MDDTLQKIRYKKVRQKLRYLQTELEETKLIYQVCLDKFNDDFSKYKSVSVDDIQAESKKIFHPTNCTSLYYGKM